MPPSRRSGAAATPQGEAAGTVTAVSSRRRSRGLANSNKKIRDAAPISSPQSMELFSPKSPPSSLKAATEVINLRTNKTQLAAKLSRWKEMDFRLPDHAVYRPIFQHYPFLIIFLPSSGFCAEVSGRCFVTTATICWVSIRYIASNNMAKENACKT